MESRPETEACERVPWDERSRFWLVAFLLTWWRLLTSPVRSMRAAASTSDGRHPWLLGFASVWLVQAFAAGCLKVLNSPLGLGSPFVTRMVPGPLLFILDMSRFVTSYWFHLGMIAMVLWPLLAFAVEKLLYWSDRRSSSFLQLQMVARVATYSLCVVMWAWVPLLIDVLLVLLFGPVSRVSVYFALTLMAWVPLSFLWWVAAQAIAFREFRRMSDASRDGQAHSLRDELHEGHDLR